MARIRKSLFKSIPCVRGAGSEGASEPNEQAPKIFQVENDLSRRRKEYQGKLIAYKDKSKECQTCHKLITELQSDYKKIRETEKELSEQTKITNRQLGEDLLTISTEDHSRIINSNKNRSNK